MIGMDLVSELVKTVILTGKIANKNFPPVSLLLISPPEHGKTSLILEQHCKAVVNLTDVTGKGLKEVAQSMTEVSHIAILDLLMVTSHKTKVSEYIMAHMNAIAEEGYVGDASPAGIRILKEPVKKAFLCALTPDMAWDGRRFWNKSGFSSRMLPFNYLFSDVLRNQVRGSINFPVSKSAIDLTGFAVPKEPVRVSFVPKLIHQVDSLAREKSDSLNRAHAKSPPDPNGFRRLKQFRSLVCAHAILRRPKRAVVAEPEIDFLTRIMPYISYTKGHEL
jgi:hypothetical protein